MLQQWRGDVSLRLMDVALDKMQVAQLARLVLRCEPSLRRSKFMLNRILLRFIFLLWAERDGLIFGQLQ